RDRSAERTTNDLHIGAPGLGEILASNQWSGTLRDLHKRSLKTGKNGVAVSDDTIGLRRAALDRPLGVLSERDLLVADWEIELLIAQSGRAPSGTLARGRAHTAARKDKKKETYFAVATSYVEAHGGALSQRS